MESSASIVGNVIGLIILFGIAVWVSVDAKAIGSDHGRMRGLVKTNPRAWAAGVFLLLIVFLPAYLIVRVRYKRTAYQRKAELALLPPEVPAETADVWPPPPQMPGV